MRAVRLTNEQVNLLIQQHSQLMIDIQNLWTILVVFAFVGVAFIGFMILAAAWSVKTVNRRQADLEGKFQLLIDVLLEDIRNRQPKPI